jgi:predicted O-methyltransferase YrrM
MTLDKIGLFYGTDKSSACHDYLRRYAEFLEPIRESARKVLELGIAGGASLKMWHDYFPNATIFGVDHNEECFRAAHFIDPSRVQPLLGEASDDNFWGRLATNWGGDFDLIVDDAGHHSSQIKTAFPSALSLVRPGGYYICEDTHCSYDPEYNRDPGGSAIEFFKLGIDLVNESGLDKLGKPMKDALFQSITFSKSLVIIRK